ncbi:bifunctional adenosylcobinamide kinase/adenosylcobinamide-phosphate guanylyltransferase [Microvirga rosea]|uniref:bifunctional adenosylcobinamide kinase/adenosylcobinamide-phosphate guanylyltransferase n=1 Tax=Microvirga rosea TaxID=2715425 RepID=UPI001D0A200E|nr:bifunctional adenosylcobinamide kinase/adenosylcobinamide-phosphate guanylyltransferase [Microvirga rosea]MCB8822280.1 bifunctional adenosylcobinamide kinase/adenosylcobinamide-phosphate guanylyltransferase [Microvirga rosea]
MTVHRRALVLGGARSGKSRTAQGLAESTGKPLLYIATAQAFDDEMRERICRHQSERDERWRTLEAPFELSEAVAEAAGADRVILVDCLTLWLSNLMLAGKDTDDETDRLALTIKTAAGPIILVSNEVGQGIVPDTALGRRFRDAQGRLNQRIAEICDAVILVAAGCPILLKPAPSLHLTFA